MAKLHTGMSRRSFLKAGLQVVGGTTVASASGGVYSIWFEPQWLALESIEMRLQRLPQAFDGFRMVQLSDLHYENATPASTVIAAIEMANQLAPDLIVLTGDYVTNRDRRHLQGMAEVVTQLHAPYGVIGVLGNHDVWSRADRVAQALEAQGITILKNQSIPIERDRSRFWIVGADDVWEHRVDIDRALYGVPEDEAKVLLVHEPDFADVAKQYSIDLQLSGHTHGGQVRLPFLGALKLPRYGHRYPIGLQYADALPVYTSRGVGMIQPAVRFNCRPEVTLFTLRSGT